MSSLRPFAVIATILALFAGFTLIWAAFASFFGVAAVIWGAWAFFSFLLDYTFAPVFSTSGWADDQQH